MVKSLLRPCLLIILASFAVVDTVRANLPGGGTNGANVTLTDNGTTLVLVTHVGIGIFTKIEPPATDAKPTSRGYTRMRAGVRETFVSGSNCERSTSGKIFE